MREALGSIPSVSKFEVLPKVSVCACVRGARGWEEREGGASAEGGGGGEKTKMIFLYCFF